MGVDGDRLLKGCAAGGCSGEDIRWEASVRTLQNREAWAGIRAETGSDQGKGQIGIMDAGAAVYI